MLGALISLADMRFSARLTGANPVIATDGDSAMHETLIMARNYVAMSLGKRPETLPLPILVFNSEAIEGFDREIRAARGMNARHATMAAYKIGFIYVRDTFSPDRDMPFLIHEMVHHAQTIYAMKYPCQQAQEVLAYHMQNHYALAHGFEQRAPEWFIEQLSKCEPDARP